MNFSEPAQKPRAESIVPMINVVFLLLIFFLMTSRLTQPDPFELRLPNSEQDTTAKGEHTLYVSKDGSLHFDGAEGNAAKAKLRAIGASADIIILRADAALPAKQLAQLMMQLASSGFKNVELIVIPE